MLATARHQHGVVHRRQALELGMSSSAIGRRLDRGTWKTLLPGVYVVGAVQASRDAVAMAACLWGGDDAVVSHRAAAGLWEFHVAFSLPEISTPRDVRSAEVGVHQVLVPKAHRTRIRGIPVTSVHRTLIDLGDVTSETVVEDALDCALRKRMTSVEWLLKEIGQIGTRGRKGATMLKCLLTGGSPPPSWLERRFIRLLAREKLSGYVREHACGPFSIDFAWVDVKLGVEVHGEKWHRRRVRWSADLARHNWLTGQGWTMLHFDWSQIDTAPRAVVDEICRSRARLEQRFDI